jgi:hypothetical protein
MRRFLFLVLLLAITPASTAFAQSCSCTQDSFDNRWERASAVFIGTVRSIRTIEERVTPGVDDLPVEVMLAVAEPFKSAAEQKYFTLHTSLTRNTCTGHPFAVGSTYLVYAYVRRADSAEHWSLYNFPSGTYDVGGLCGGTKSGSEAVADLKLIDNKIRNEQETKDKSLFNRASKQFTRGLLNE